MTGLSLHGDVWMGGAPLIRDLALEIPGGGWSCLLGPSGIGKSTIARLIAGLPGPHHLKGSLRGDDGQPLTGRVAFMAQRGQLLPWADLVANVTIGARLRGTRPDVSRAMALLSDVGLDGMAQRRPSALSGGQQQRVALARVLIEDAPIVVLDEPFSALDTVTRLDMQDLSARVLAGRTVILITHDPLEALRLADRAWLLGKDGAQSLLMPDGLPPRAATNPTVLHAQADLMTQIRREVPCST